LPFDLSKLSDKERRHYYALEALLVFSYGEFNDKEEIIRGIIETIDD